MSGKRDRASELRAIAEGRLMLNVRNGVTVSRSMLAMIADEFEAMSTTLAAKDAELAEVRKALDALDRMSRGVDWCDQDEQARRWSVARRAPEGHHPDDIAVDRFAAAMKEKLARKREEGRGGWDDKEKCSGEYLSRLLREHVDKGDPVDVGNLAMMLHQRGERIAPEGQQDDEPVAWGVFYRGKIVAVSLHKSYHYTVPLYTRPSEQAVTEAWRPIETAPKDGTPVLLARFDRPGATDDDLGPDGATVGHWAHFPGGNGGWYLSGLGVVGDHGGDYHPGNGAFSNNGWPELDPTHWMPLPTPPAKAQEGK